MGFMIIFFVSGLVIGLISLFPLRFLGGQIGRLNKPNRFLAMLAVGIGSPLTLTIIGLLLSDDLFNWMLIAFITGAATLITIPVSIYYAVMAGKERAVA